MIKATFLRLLQMEFLMMLETSQDGKLWAVSAKSTKNIVVRSKQVEKLF